MVKRILIFLICILLLLITGCGKSNAPEEIDNGQKIVVNREELAISIPDDLKTLDPLKAGNSWELQIVSYIYEGLVGYNPDTRRIEPALAKEWATSSDGLTYTFRLREQAIFHSGEIVTAEDVKASWERAIRYSNEATWYIFNNIVGFEQYSSGRAESIAGVTVVNDEILEVILSTPDKTFLQKLTHPATAIVDVEFVNNSTYGYGLAGTVEEPTRVNGTGPFALVEWAPHQNITLEHFVDHPISSQFKRVDFRLSPDIEIGYADLKRGYVDILRNDRKLPELILEKEPIVQEQLVEEAKAEILYLGFNLKKGPFQDQGLRQAISYALDRKKLIESINANAEAVGLLPRAIVQNRNPITEYVYSQESAKQLVNYFNEESSGRIEFSLHYVNEENNATLAERITDRLNEIGLKVTPKALDSYQELYSGIKSGTISFYLNRWTAQSEEAGFFLTPLFYSKSPYNLSGYSNELVDELLGFIQNQKPFSEEYIESILQLEKLIMSDVPMITLLEVEDYLISSKLVSAPALDPVLGVQLLKVRMNTEITL